MQGVVLSALDRWNNQIDEKFKVNYVYPSKVINISTYGYTEIPKIIVNKVQTSKKTNNQILPHWSNRIGLYPVNHSRLKNILNRLDNWDPKQKGGYDWDYS